MATITNGLPEPVNVGVNGADRSIMAQLTNPNDIAREDWLRDVQKMKYTNDFNAQEAEKNRVWQEKLSNTAYQRAVEDMKKAGINPILGLGMANHASTPSGGVASGSMISSQGYTSRDNGVLDFVSNIMNVIAGVYTSGANNITKLNIAKLYKLR